MNDKGFSLIELVIVIVILGIASVGLMSVFSTGTKKSADPLLENQALQLAQEKMEIIIGDRMNTARGFKDIRSVNYPAESPVTGFPGFSRMVETCCVTAADLNAIPPSFPCSAPDPIKGCLSGYTHVTVTVTHAAFPGAVTVATLVTDY